MQSDSTPDQNPPEPDAPTPLPEARKRGSRPWVMPAVLFLALWFTFAYFEHVRAGWNVNTRLGLVYAMVERGTFSIDAYHDEKKSPLTATNDKAFFNGHYYCDKSPALSFAAAPVYYLAWQVRLRSNFLGDLHTRKYGYWVLWTRYLARVSTVSLSAALLGVLCWGFARRFGTSPTMAFLLSLGILVGTVLSGYATLFYAYLPSALCCMASYWILLNGRLEHEIDGPEKRSLAGGTRLFWAGLLLGLSWFFEYTVGLAGIGLGFYALWAARRKPWTMWKFIVGGLIPVVVFFAYTRHVFGEFAIPYKYEAHPFFREEMAKGFQGIHLPRLSVLYYVTIHPYKGLFFFSPFLVLFLPGAWAVLARGRERRFLPDVLLSLFVIVAYLLFNAGYYMWYGGWASGPRLLCPAAPFFLAPIAIWIANPRREKLLVFSALLSLSIAANFIIMAVEPQVPNLAIADADLMHPTIARNLPSPVLDTVFPAFFQGMDNGYDLLAENLATWFLGIHGKKSLLPLGFVWLGIAGWLVATRRGKRR